MSESDTSSTLHSFPFYMADWRGSEDVESMTPTARALYLELLIVAYMRGSLPTEEKLLWKAARFDAADFKRAWKYVKPMFFLKDGRYHHHKVDEIRPRLLNWAAARRKGGQNRHYSSSSSSAIAEAIAPAIDQLDLQPPSSSSSSSSSSSDSSSLRSEESLSLNGRTNGHSKGVLKRLQSGWFDQFWAEYWVKVGKDAARAKFCTKVRDEETFKRVMEAIRLQTPEMMNREAKYIPHPATWLNQGRWEDEGATLFAPHSEYRKYSELEDPFKVS